MMKRRRMIKSEIDRLLSDEGTRNLLSGILNKKNNKVNRIVTRNKTPPRRITNSLVNNNNNNNNKSKKIIKKSLSLLGHNRVVVNNEEVKVSENNCNLIAKVVRGNVCFLTLAYHRGNELISSQDVEELWRRLEECEIEKGISVIVLNSASDRIFCDGFDYKELIHSDLNKRKSAISKRANSIKKLLLTLSRSKKLLACSVNGGRVSGFGVVLLTHFDLVYANDKATFSLAIYNKLNQHPEGISTINNFFLNHSIMRGMMFGNRTYTSTELQQGSLITELLWDGSKYHEELAVRLQNVNPNTKSIYKTFAAKNIKQIDLNAEFNLLESQWASDQWQSIAELF